MYTLKNASSMRGDEQQRRAKCASLTGLCMSSEFGGCAAKRGSQAVFLSTSLANLDGQLDQRIHAPDLGGDHRF